jgi:ribulose kinase
MLLKGCFSPRQIFTATTDFVEVYLMIAVAVAFGVRLVLT